VSIAEKAEARQINLRYFNTNHVGISLDETVSRSDFDEIFEVFAIANLVGGTIVIPHTRRAIEFWEDLKDG